MPRRRIELGVTSDHVAASQLGRRQVLAAVFGILTIGLADAGEQRRFRIAFANLNDDPSARVEGLGFSGAEVRRSFELASRTLPVDMIYYDNGGDPEAALANAYDAIGRKVDLFIEYNADAEADAEIARKLKAAAIPVLAVNYPIPGRRFTRPTTLRRARSPARRWANSPSRAGRTRRSSPSSPATSAIRQLICPSACKASLTACIKIFRTSR